jgi:hypothetical protein
VGHQVTALRGAAVQGRALASSIPRLQHLFVGLKDMTW